MSIVGRRLGWSKLLCGRYSSLHTSTDSFAHSLADSSTGNSAENSRCFCARRVALRRKTICVSVQSFGKTMHAESQLCRGSGLKGVPSATTPSCFCSTSWAAKVSVAGRRHSALAKGEQLPTPRPKGLVLLSFVFSFYFSWCSNNAYWILLVMVHLLGKSCL